MPVEWPRTVVMSTEVPLDTINGVNNALKNLFPLFTQKGIDVLIHSPHPKKGFKLPLYPGVRFALGFPSLFNEITDNKRDVAVHAWAPFTLGFWLLDWADENHIPRVASFNTNIPKFLESYFTSFRYLNSITKFAWFFFKSVHNMAQINLAPSDSVGIQMKEKRFKNVKTWTRGVDTELFNPEKRNDELRQKLTDGHPEKSIILYVGRLAKEKNLERIQLLISSLPQAQFVIVGDGPIKADLENKFAFKNVKFTGFLEGEELAEIYASSEIFLTPSFASGLPVVCFDAPGIKELVRESGAGFLAKYDDWEELRDNLLKLLNSQEIRKDFGLLGRNYSKTMSWEKRFQELLDFYRLLKKK